MSGSWDGYDKDTRDKLKEHPAIVGAINQMYRDGHSKEYAQKISGAPYEVVDRLYKNQNRQRRQRDDSGPRPDEDE